MGNLPTRKGPWIGRGNERQMMDESDVQAIRKRYRTNPDGSVTMLKTRAGWPQFTTTEIVQSSAKFTSTGVLQATTHSAGAWNTDRYLSKSRGILLKPSTQDFFGHVNWFDKTVVPSEVISYPITSMEIGSWAKLGVYGMGAGHLYLNGSRELDFSTFAHPDFDEYSIYAEIVCAGRTAGVTNAVLRFRYYTTTTSDFVLIRKTGAGNYCGLAGWELVSIQPVGWDEPRFAQPPVMNASCTEFSSVVAELVDTSNPLAYKYQLKVASWSLPAFVETDSYPHRRRDYQRTTPHRPGEEEVVNLPGDLSYVHALKAAQEYDAEEVVSEYVRECPAFVSYNGDVKVCMLKVEESKTTSTLNYLFGTDRTFSYEQHWSYFDLGDAYSNNLSLMQGLVFSGGATLSPSQAESHANSATYGGSAWAVLTGTMPVDTATVVGRSADHRYFYWQDRKGDVVYVPHPTFPLSQPIAQRLENSFKSVKYRGGVRKNDEAEVWTMQSDSSIFGDEAGGVIRRTTIAVDREPALTSASYFVPHPSGSVELPGITVNVTRLVTGYSVTDVPDEILSQIPVEQSQKNDGEVIWHDARGDLHVKDKDGALVAKFGPIDSVAPGVGPMENLGPFTAVLETMPVISSSHPSKRLLGCSLHPGLADAAIIDMVDPSADPIQPNLVHATAPSGTRIVPDQPGEKYVSAVYFRK